MEFLLKQNIINFFRQAQKKCFLNQKPRIYGLYARKKQLNQPLTTIYRF